MLLALFLIWLTGAIGMYILDGFLDFGLEEFIKDNMIGGLIFCCSIWWLLAPLAIVNGLRERGKNYREKQKKKEKEAEKIRVAVQKDIEENMEEVEQEVLGSSKAVRRR